MVSLFSHKFLFRKFGNYDIYFAFELNNFLKIIYSHIVYYFMSQNNLFSYRVILCLKIIYSHIM